MSKDDKHTDTLLGNLKKGCSLGSKFCHGVLTRQNKAAPTALKIAPRFENTVA